MTPDELEAALLKLLGKLDTPESACSLGMVLGVPTYDVVLLLSKLESRRRVSRITRTGRKPTFILQRDTDADQADQRAPPLG